MGEIAESMMDGTICSDCGVLLGDPVGYPRYCNSCHAHNMAGSYRPRQIRRRKVLKRIQDSSGRWHKTRRVMTAEEKQVDNKKRLERRKRAKARAAQQAGGGDGDS